jgi:hypothetical protein
MTHRIQLTLYIVFDGQTAWRLLSSCALALFVHHLSTLVSLSLSGRRAMADWCQRVRDSTRTEKVPVRNGQSQRDTFE